MNPNHITAMFLGDSIVKGYPTDSGFRDKIERTLKGRPITFVGPLEDEAGRKHAGFIGYTAAGILKILPELLSYRPDMLIVSLGGNGLPDTPAAAVGAEIETIVRAFISNGTRTVYVSLIPDVNGYTPLVAAYNSAIRRAVGQIPQVHVINMGARVGRAEKDSPFYSDAAHMSRLGYELMADDFLRTVFHIEPKKDPPASASVGGTRELVRSAKGALLRAYPNIDQRLGEYALAMGLLCRYGREAPWTYRGEPSHNWSAHPHRPGIDGLFYPLDDKGRENGSSPLAKFAVPEEGAIMAVETLAKKDVQKALSDDEPLHVAFCLGKDAMYGEALKRALEIVRRESAPSHVAPLTSDSTSLTSDSTSLTSDSASLTSASLFSTAATGADAEPVGSPFSVWNVGVLAVVAGIFAATLMLDKSKSGHVDSRR